MSTLFHLTNAKCSSHTLTLYIAYNTKLLNIAIVLLLSVYTRHEHCYAKHLKVVSYLTDNTQAMLTKRPTSDVQSFRGHKVDE